MVERCWFQGSRSLRRLYVVNDLKLSLEQLHEISEALKQKIAEGLAEENREIACLPTYLELPSGSQIGEALVVDTGGTNMRAAVVRLEVNDGHIEKGPIAARVPDGRQGKALLSDDFFGAQAALSQGLRLEKQTLPLGYCFSYPARSETSGDAVLLKWTKGLNIDGVVGTKVGQALQRSLDQAGIQTGNLKVLNDTVASLIGGAHLNISPHFGSNYIGLILGTGTNMAGVFRPSQLTKISASKSMIVNLESGNFLSPHLTEFDDAVDSESNNPGAQKFEKAVSGHYLPYVFERMFPESINPENGTKQLVDIRESGQGQQAEAARLLLRRSAQMVAASLLAVDSFYEQDKCTAILGEGSLLWGDPLYAPLVRQTLGELSPDRKFELVRQRDNVNLLGAAAATL